MMEIYCAEKLHMHKKLDPSHRTHTVKVDFATAEVAVDASASAPLASSARTKAAARTVAPTAKRIVSTPAISHGPETT